MNTKRLLSDLTLIVGERIYVKRGATEWGTWEKRIFADANLQGFEISRLHEEVRGLYTAHPAKVKSDVDYVMGIEGLAVWFEAKSTHDRLWNLKKRVFRPATDKQSSTIHQWAKLLSATRRGNLSGYLLWFVVLNKISWVPIQAIELAVKEGRDSIHPESPGVRSQSDDTQIFFKKLVLP